MSERRLERGIYYISNANAFTVIDMLDGQVEDGSRIGAWDRVDRSGLNSYNQLWFIDPVDVADSPYDARYTIRNLRAGTYMDLANTVPYTNGATLVGRARGGDSQLWYIREEQHGFMRICNSMTQTYVDLTNGQKSRGSMISGWSWVGYTPARFNQLWKLEKVSLTSTEVGEKLRAHPNLGKSIEIRNPEGIYLPLPTTTYRIIYKQTGLQPGKLKKGLFDGDDFAFVFKSAISTWGDQNLRADGFGLLCGVLFVESAHGSHAINWTLSSSFPDASVLFIEPQDGSLNETFPADYKVHFGLF